MKEITSERLQFDIIGGQWLETKFTNGSISVKPLTATEAAEWQARNGY